MARQKFIMGRTPSLTNRLLPNGTHLRWTSIIKLEHYKFLLWYINHPQGPGIEAYKVIERVLDAVFKKQLTHFRRVEAKLRAQGIPDHEILARFKAGTSESEEK